MRLRINPASPSHSEGSPYVLLEAMAARLPIVATAVGGVPEIAKDEESALLVPARDPQAMSKAIVRVLIDSELASKLTRNALTQIATHHSPDIQTRSLIDVYFSVLTNRQQSLEARN